jgi:hypothetical protein
MWIGVNDRFMMRGPLGEQFEFAPFWEPVALDDGNYPVRVKLRDQVLINPSGTRKYKGILV